MRTAFIAATLFALSIGGAAAAVPQAPAPRPLYTCDNHGLSRVALKETPAPCCTGMFGCPQLLSNTGLIKPKHDNRT